MHRQPLLKTLERHLELYPQDRLRVNHVRQFVRVHSDCFERTCEEGHITGSAWVASSDGARVLLTLHRKLGTWLQLGGHADGDRDVAAVALREAQEESGLSGLELFRGAEGFLPLDVDVHLIPERPGEPAHLHHDIRYLVLADDRAKLRSSEESIALCWFDGERATEVQKEGGMRRMARRARRLLASARDRREVKR